MVKTIPILPVNTSGWMLILPLIALLAAGCATSNQSRESTLSKSEVNSLLIQRRAVDYSIQAGDQIEISVWGYEEFNTTKTVTTRGIVTVPLIGEIEAEGQTKEQFKSNLSEKLKKYIEGEINLSVTITSPSRNVVSVLGSVGRPDNYAVVNNISLFQILSKAGGTNEQADLRNIKLYKEGTANEPVNVDLTTYLNRGETGSMPVVQPGDIIYVPREENAVRELSDFIRDVVLLFGLFRVFN